MSSDLATEIARAMVEYIAINGGRPVVKQLDELIPYYLPLANVAIKVTEARNAKLEAAIREYAYDLRRNSSGGDNYDFNTMKSVADYLEILIDRANQQSTEKP